MAKSHYVFNEKAVEVEQFTKSTVEIVSNEDGGKELIIVMFFGRKEEPGWTHAAAFGKTTAQKLLADLNVKLQNFP